jgi:anti-sigma factor RsiW
MSHQHHHDHDQRLCREVFAVLSQYVDGELGPVDCSQVEAHLKGCAPCIEFLDSLKKSIALSHEFQPDVAGTPLPAEARRKLAEAYREALARR